MLTTNIAVKKNQKFTTAALGCFLRLPLTSHNLAFASLLARSQMNASLYFPTIAAQQYELAQLYDLQFEVVPQLFGKEILLTYYVNFVEPLEILDPDYSYERVIAIIAQIIQHPSYEQNLLELTKRQLSSDYRELLQQPANYALEKFFKLWYQTQPDYASTFMGSMAEIQQATTVQLKHYADSLRSVPTIVIGMGKDERLMHELMQDYFKEAGILKEFAIPDLTIPAPQLAIKKTETQHNLQAQLLVGYGFKKKINYEEQIIGLILSQYLAGDQSSKLFTEIREELGAAYDVEANSFANNSLFLISAGLDPRKIVAAQKIILTEVQKVAAGEINQQLFHKAQKALYRNHQFGLDGQNFLLGQALREQLLPGYANVDRAKIIKKATPHQLAQFAQNLFWNESYILK